ncbi:MAG: hypothetical protein KAS90_05355 [Candidatus Aenigmarchaeota archaeon]|nr:hypothetical protein [Candidatus Aenigmarchaeota archaeon]
MIKNENKSTAGQEIKKTEKIEGTLEKALVSLNLFSPEVLLLVLAIVAG